MGKVIVDNAIVNKVLIRLSQLTSKYIKREDIELILMAIKDENQTVAQHDLAVWYGPMPESNGKTNWTAILYRKNPKGIISGLAECHTIDRSEYPDRVRYEADRVRYLIGEIKEQPFILDYDDKKHSDYVEPIRKLEVTSEVKDKIREIFLRNGFTIKDGCEDLKDYVYAAAFDLINEVLNE